MISALPVIPSIGCSAIPGLSAVCGAASSVGSSILGAGAGDVLSSIAGGVAQGASWLLGQIGTVMASTTSIDLGASWFKAHYEVMVGLAAVVLVPLLLASVIQAIYHQSASALLRTALGAPAAGLVARGGGRAAGATRPGGDRRAQHRGVPDVVERRRVGTLESRVSVGRSGRRGHSRHAHLRGPAGRVVPLLRGAAALGGVAGPGRGRLRGHAVLSARAGQPGDGRRSRSGADGSWKRSRHWSCPSS